MKFKSYDKQISVLDWFIIFSIIILFIMVYIPQSIWQEEANYKQDRRTRMDIISKAEDFYYELTNEYTSDLNLLFSTVESVMNSQISDSLYYGSRNINVTNSEGLSKRYEVNVEKDFSVRVDTTFSISEQINKVVIDTIYTIGLFNEDSMIDTFDVKDLSKYVGKPQFDNIYATSYEQREQVFINYLRQKFHLSDDLLYCPISKNNLNEKFIIEIINDDKEPNIKILSSVTPDDKEWRYGIFRYDPGKQEVIDNGVKSWASK